MPEQKPKLAIADPSLVDERGHHYYLTQLITQGAKRAGLQVIWLAHEEFSARGSMDGIRVIPTFSATMYDRYHPERKASLPDDLDARLYEELERGIGQAGLGCEDQLLFHTGYGDVYRALERLYVREDWQDLPFVHVCTPYDLDTMPGRDGATDLAECLGRIRTFEPVDKKVFFWAETPQLAQHYTLTYGFNTRALPLPPAHGEQQPETGKADDAVVALYLGAAREEKGFTLLPDLVEALYEEYGKTGKLRFEIQCTPQIIGYLPVIKEALEKLRKFSPPYVTLIDTTLDEQQYHAKLLASDIVLLLYSRKTYRIRGSGIAVEAVCGDKSLLTFENTFCASLLTHGGGVAVSQAREAATALARMVDQKDLFAQKAKSQGQEYRRKYSVENYVSRLLGQTGPAGRVPFFPSSIVGHVRPQLCKL